MVNVSKVSGSHPQPSEKVESKRAPGERGASGKRGEEAGGPQQFSAVHKRVLHETPAERKVPLTAEEGARIDDDLAPLGQLHRQSHALYESLPADVRDGMSEKQFVHFFAMMESFRHKA